VILFCLTYFPSAFYVNVVLKLNFLYSLSTNSLFSKYFFFFMKNNFDTKIKIINFVNEKLDNLLNKYSFLSFDIHAFFTSIYYQVNIQLSVNEILIFAVYFFLLSFPCFYTPPAILILVFKRFYNGFRLVAITIYQPLYIHLFAIYQRYMYKDIWHLCQSTIS